MKYLMKSALILIISFNYSSAADPDQLLKDVKGKFESVKDFSAEIRQSGNNPVFNGTVFYKKSNKFRIELKNITIISDGETIWNYNKKENKVVVNDVSEENLPFSFETLLDEYPSKSSLSSRTEGSSDVLVLVPRKNSGLRFKSASLWINSENLIEKIVIEQDNTVELRISDYRLNQDIPDSRFKFEAPEGSSVIDLR